MRISDWSSDVCSSDLTAPLSHPRHMHRLFSSHSAAAGNSRALQALYEQLEQIRDPLRASTAGLEQPQLRRCKEIMDTMTLSDIGKRSEEHTSELQSLMRISYAVFCLKKKTHNTTNKIKYYQHTK